jgi:Holliday junction DNA helicase RuvA
MGVKKDEELEIYTYTHLREQEIRLFGFRTRDMLIIFEKLLGVQGVGPKIASKLLNMIGVEDIVNAIISEDSAALKIPGLGEKISKKIIIDLKNKIDKNSVQFTPGIKLDKKTDDIVAALQSLGYQKERIVEALKNIDSKEIEPQGVIKEALKLLNQSNY